MKRKSDFFAGHESRAVSSLWILVFFAAVGISLAGCQKGGKDTGQTVQTSDLSTGNAVSGAVSSVLLQDANEKYPYVNDRSVYVANERGVTQYSLFGEELKSFTLPVVKDNSNGIEWKASNDFEYSDLLWVDNKELIWVNYYYDGDEYETGIVCDAPIRQTEDGEELLTDETTVLFELSDRDNISIASDHLSLDQVYDNRIFADDRYIYWIDAISSGRLLVYDRKTGERRFMSEDCVTCSQYSFIMDNNRYDNLIFCHNRGIEVHREGKIGYGFCEFNLETNKFRPIDDRCFESAAYVADPNTGKVYYQISHSQGIWEYDAVEKEKKELISVKTLKKCYEENHLLWEDAYFNDSLYLALGRCYLIKNQVNPQIFSWSLADGEIRYERALTEAVKKTGYPEDGGLTIVGDQLLLAWTTWGEQEAAYVTYALCIDLKSAVCTSVTDHLPEAIYFAAIGAWDPENETYFSDWKEKKWETPDETEGTEPVSLSETEQLQLFYRERAKWIDWRYFAITDLDHNGRLELIVSSGEEGSGNFTRSVVYQITADGKGIRSCTRSWLGDGADLLFDDLVEGMETAYVDKKTNTWFYRTYDAISGGSGKKNHDESVLVLKNGMFYQDTFAWCDIDWDEKKNKEIKHYYCYRDGKAVEISQKEYNVDQIEKQYFKGYEKRDSGIVWKKIPEVKKGLKKKLMECMEQSCP